MSDEILAPFKLRSSYAALMAAVAAVLTAWISLQVS
jgi:hypothetical protein